MRSPYFDSIEYPFVPQYATGLSQFRAGNIQWYVDLRAEDVLDLKRSLPKLAMYQTDVVANGIRTLFGLQPSADGKKSPFLDARVRQAYSLAMNRDLWIEVVYNTDNFAKEGLPIDTRWNTALVADVFEGWWLDPKSKDFGPNARYFQHNVAESKKLLASLGWTDRNGDGFLEDKAGNTIAFTLKTNSENRLRVSMANVGESLDLLAQYGGLDPATKGKPEDWVTLEYLP